MLANKNIRSVCYFLKRFFFIFNYQFVMRIHEFEIVVSILTKWYTFLSPVFELFMMILMLVISNAMALCFFIYFYFYLSEIISYRSKHTLNHYNILFCLSAAALSDKWFIERVIPHQTKSWALWYMWSPWLWQPNYHLWSVQCSSWTCLLHAEPF